jgi:hypothetical protein
MCPKCYATCWNHVANTQSLDAKFHCCRTLCFSGELNIKTVCNLITSVVAIQTRALLQLNYLVGCIAYAIVFICNSVCNVLNYHHRFQLNYLRICNLTTCNFPRPASGEGGHNTVQKWLSPLVGIEHCTIPNRLNKTREELLFFNISDIKM